MCQPVCMHALASVSLSLHTCACVRRLCVRVRISWSSSLRAGKRLRPLQGPGPHPQLKVPSNGTVIAACENDPDPGSSPKPGEWELAVSGRLTGLPWAQEREHSSRCAESARQDLQNPSGPSPGPSGCFPAGSIRRRTHRATATQPLGGCLSLPQLHTPSMPASWVPKAGREEESGLPWQGKQDRPVQASQTLP